MPTEELKQALRTANVRNVEKDLIEVLARMFDAPIPLVARVVYAATQATGSDKIVWDNYLEPNLRKAIKELANEGLRRAYLRGCVEQGGYALVWVEAMVPENKPEMICNGCPKSLECVAESLHNPADCRVGKGAWAKTLETRPIKIHGDTVTVDCNHPRGQFVLDLKDFNL